MTERFTDALHHLDAERDPEPLVELTAEDAELVKLDSRHEARGRDGARTFWTGYRDVFGELRTTFTHTITSDDSAALEWTSEGTLRDGKPFSYRGVTVIEGDEQRVHGVRTYYDSAAFVQPPAATT